MERKRIIKGKTNNKLHLYDLATNEDQVIAEMYSDTPGEVFVDIWGNKVLLDVEKNSILFLDSFSIPFL